MNKNDQAGGGYSEAEKYSVARAVMQNVLFAIAPLSDEGFRHRTWVHGENPGYYGSSYEEVTNDLDCDIPIITGNLAPYVPLSLDQTSAIQEFAQQFLSFADSLPYAGLWPAEILADARWPEITRLSRALLERLATELGSDFLFPPWIHGSAK